ncbi:hypothetical protein PsYK624_003250 [Phanerochaete sordida]|uniref:Uncharacterized protein n=1 Tax=Phanerochaete sordida TaxID=48140 RepID=A0A9P3L786_9APHY|nr:hypothetical protein PsYK624_003250 [Phanerochaete sordida]
MCKYRRVRNVYTQCGHGVNLPEVEINCELDNCVFSARHPEDCQGEACRNRCWQYHQYPEQYSPNINTLCPACQAAGGAQ